MPDNLTTDILDALRDRRHSGHLNSAAADEIERLRGWLVWIEGRHGPMDEAAAAALAGRPIPEDFSP